MDFVGFFPYFGTCKFYIISFLIKSESDALFQRNYKFWRFDSVIVLATFILSLIDEFEGGNQKYPARKSNFFFEMYFLDYTLVCF